MSSTNAVEKNWSATDKNLSLDPQLTSYPKINSKWTKDFNMAPKFIIYIEEKIDRILSDMEPRNIFSDSMLLAKQMEAQVKKRDYVT